MTQSDSDSEYIFFDSDDELDPLEELDREFENESGYIVKRDAEFLRLCAKDTPPITVKIDYRIQPNGKLTILGMVCSGVERKNYHLAFNNDTIRKFAVDNLVLLNHLNNMISIEVPDDTFVCAFNYAMYTLALLWALPRRTPLDLNQIFDFMCANDISKMLGPDALKMKISEVLNLVGFEFVPDE